MKKKTLKYLSLVLALMLLSFLLTGCAAGAIRDAISNGSGGSGAKASSSASYSGAMTEAYYDMDAPVPAPAEYATGEYDSMMKGETAGTADSYDKIIYSGYATVETIRFDETLEQVYEMIDAYGGFLESSYVTGKDYYSTYYNRNTYRTASFTIRVPRSAFQSFTGALETLGNVTGTTIEAQNITTSYYDTESRLATYRTEEERLLAMLEKADTVEDMLNIEDRLASVRYNIESLTSTLTNWDSKLSYSTVELRISEVSELTQQTPITYTFGQRIVQGFKSSVSWLGNAGQALVVFIAGALPILVILAVITLIIIFIIRAKRKKKKEKMMVNLPVDSPK